MTDDALPVIWLLHGSRTGDNAQISTLGSLLDAKIVVKHLSFNILHHFPAWLLGASVVSLKVRHRNQLTPPWPDIVIAAGKRPVAVARFIKKSSGGRTKLVHVGRPRALLRSFDLIVTTPQYGVPLLPNVIELPLPFAIPLEVDESERMKWSAAWNSLPRPWIVAAIGAGKFPKRMDTAVIRDLGEALDRLATASGGSVIAMGSPRTSSDVMARLAMVLKGPALAYPFQRENSPYQAALALADRIVVTSDSMSMLAEAINSGKPVSIFRLPVSPFFPRWSAESRIGGWLATSGLLAPPRNMPAAVDRLIREGYASSLGDEPAVRGALGPDYDAVVFRIRALAGF